LSTNEIDDGFPAGNLRIGAGPWESEPAPFGLRIAACVKGLVCAGEGMLLKG
jgi:hypothetical protein